jgi:hypothetical protein
MSPHSNIRHTDVTQNDFKMDEKIQIISCFILAIFQLLFVCPYFGENFNFLLNLIEKGGTKTKINSKLWIDCIHCGAKC